MTTWEPIEQDKTTYTEDTDWMWLMRMAYTYWILNSIRHENNEYILPEANVGRWTEGGLPAARRIALDRL